jgi:membrane-bound lytic murein transglycosylase D
MTKLCFLLLLLSAFAATAQTNTLVLDDNFMQAVQAWAKDNLDEDALNSLGEVDEAKVKEFLGTLQKDFRGDYVIDLAQLKTTANLILPLLEAHDETAPYAIWLKTRLDYLDTADQLRLLIPPTKPEPDKPTRPPSPPPASQVREIWIKKISTRPWPAEAKPFVTKLKPIFTAEKVPAELVWVAEVESSFDARASSPAGATGLFQLMPQTAKQYGLHTWPFDERKQPEESAHAAAKHLHYLHAKFKDWRLALAAYNAGEGTVQNLLKRYKAQTYDAIAAHLPAETQMYVPKIEATLLRREGLKLTELSLPRATMSPN